MPERLRIAHVVDAPFEVDRANGVSEAVRCLATAQAEIGESIAVFSGVDGFHEFVPDRRPRIAERVSRDVFAWRPDVLHFHSVHVPQHVALGARARRLGIVYCVTTHGGLFAAALRRGRVKKVVFNALFERRFLRQASFVHAVSPHEVTAIRDYGFEGPIVVVPNGLPADTGTVPPPEPWHAAQAFPRDKRIFMFIGRLDSWQKGLDLLIEAFARAGLADAALVLVGPDDHGSRRSLQQLAERLGIGSRVVFTGAAFGADRARLFAAADMFVHPSRWEGLSLSVLAAAAAGKPCLVTRDADPLGSLERAHAALVVEPTASSVAAGLRRFSTLSAAELKAMGARAKQVVDAHTTWPEAAEQLSRAYRHAIGLSSSKMASRDASCHSSR